MIRTSLRLFAFNLTLAACSAFSGDDGGSGPAASPPEGDAGSGDTSAPPVGAEDAPIAITVTGPAKLVQGGAVSIPVKVARKGVGSSIRVSATRLPVGVGVKELVLATESEGSVELTATTAAAQGPVTGVQITATTVDHTATAALDLFVRGPGGALDTTYATAGTLDFGVSPAFIVDRSAKHVIVSVSGITLKRFARDGSPDNAFTPVSGPLVTPVIALDDSVYTAASATISHYSAAGAADTNYGTAGKSVTITPSPITSSLNLGPAPANAVIAFGNNMVLTETRATKLDANGAFDAGFAFTPWSHPNAGETIAGPIHVLPGGSFLAAVGAKTIGVGLVRFTATGALDTTFAGGAGYVDAPMATTSAIMTAAGLRVTGDYAFVLGTGNTADKHGLARFTLNGTLDAGFGEAASPGVLSTPSRPPGTGAAFDIDPSGRPVVASVTTVGGTRMLSLARYTAAGKPDVAFAPTGFVTMPFGTVAPRAVVAVDAERALVIGVKDGNGFIARFWM